MSKRWSAPTERIVIQLAIIAGLLSVVAATTYLAAIRSFDKTTAGALLGSVAGSLGAALVHKLSSRDDGYNNGKSASNQKSIEPPQGLRRATD